MRVIAGKFRSFRLQAPEGDTTRPITDRVKETIFNVLGARLGVPGQLPEIDVLDLFAGSGSFGIECLSRGARSCCFVERDRRALPALRANVARIEAQAECRIRAENAWTMRMPATERFGLIFVDPPYRDTDDAIRILDLLDRLAPALTVDGMLVFRLPASGEIPTAELRRLTCIDEREFGTMRVLLLQRPADQQTASAAVRLFATAAPEPMEMNMPEDLSQLVPVEHQPFNAETPMPSLAAAQTPTPQFYVRNHFDIPRIDLAAWRLAVDGAVERPLSLSLADIAALPARTLVVTMECAGNGRMALKPRPPGTPWAFGAVSTARFTGTPLRDVLDRTGVHGSAAELLFVGDDAGRVDTGNTVAYERSLPVPLARHEDVLLAWAMNDAPLTPSHGFPLRLIVPGWYGMASVKWLRSIRAIERPFSGFFQTDRYLYVDENGIPGSAPVEQMRVRSVIATPSEGAALPLAPVRVAGSAWSGFGLIERVEFSDDEGERWTRARLAPAASPYAAATWVHDWTPARAGRYTLLARATDFAGNQQPLSNVRNVQGYGNNVCQRVTVTVG